MGLKERLAAKAKAKAVDAEKAVVAAPEVQPAKFAASTVVLKQQTADEALIASLGALEIAASPTANAVKVSDYRYKEQADSIGDVAVQEFYLLMHDLVNAQELADLDNAVRDVMIYTEEHAELHHLLLPEVIGDMVRALRKQYASTAKNKQAKKTKTAVKKSANEAKKQEAATLLQELGFALPGVV